MKSIYILFLITLISILSVNAQQTAERSSPGSNFNSNWQFIKNADTSILPSLFNQATNNWAGVSLPHTASIEPLIKLGQQWQGISMYRKFFTVPATDKGKYIALQFDAAMNKADVFLNGTLNSQHLGGYLPFQIDISRQVVFGAPNCILVRLNNSDDAEIPPGKPIKDLDFNYYGGIYRNAWLIIKNRIRISDAVVADHLNGGGLLVHYTGVSSKEAVLNLKCEVQNDEARSKAISVKAVLRDSSGKTVAETNVAAAKIKAGSAGIYEQKIPVLNPQLWSPSNPYLYTLSVYVLSGTHIVDSSTLRTGIHSLAFKADGFYLNEKKLMIRGTNRHQEYPYIGNALSDNAQYRDAWKIKEAGFNFVRCSHYPPSPAFLDACDELGILVMDSTPGWQYFGDEAFQENSLKNIRDMVHRDRNHASIAVWEASLNETEMKRPYMVKANNEVHTELPYATTFTCGWIDDVYDVFIPARQHAKAPDYWKKFAENKPLLIAEYGDWEYYAQNAGFNQTEYQNLKKEDKSSRQIRGDGQERLLQQALNYQEAHNDNLNGRMTGDLNWLMFDYKRGYATDTQTSGIMDFFRLPKFSFYFFQSQKDIAESRPMLFIASYWNDPADKTVKVYSNTDEVELKLNGVLVARQKADTGPNSTNLTHPPFTFHVSKFEAGTLVATGFVNGKEIISSGVRTPGAPAKILLRADLSNREFKAGTNDVLFVYASIVDKDGTLIPNAGNLIQLSVEGPAKGTGDQQVHAEAGIASFLITGGDRKGKVIVKAVSDTLETGELTLDLH